MKTLKEKFWLNEEAETPDCEMSYRDYEAVGYFQGQKKAYEDVKEAVLDYSNLSKNWRKNNNTEKMLFKKYNLNDDMSLEDCYIKIFGDFEK